MYYSNFNGLSLFYLQYKLQLYMHSYINLKMWSVFAYQLSEDVNYLQKTCQKIERLIKRFLVLSGSKFI